MPRAWAIVPAAGSGERFGKDCPKQFSVIQGHTLLSYTLAGLLACDEIEQVIVVTSDKSKIGKLPLWWKYESDSEEWAKCSSKNTSEESPERGWSDKPPGVWNADDCEAVSCPSLDHRVHCVAGSTSRHRSIKCGLDAIDRIVKEDASRGAPDVVLVHDGVRPLVPTRLVSALVSAAAADGAAGLTRPLVSTVLETAPSDVAQLKRSLDRAQHCASETPQAFALPVIVRAYQQCSERELDHGTECLQLALTHAGVAARLLAGSADLWKVTYRRDLHALRGVVDDTRVHLAVVSAPGLEDVRDSLVSRLSERLARVTAAPAARLADCSCSSLVMLRHAGPAEGAAPERAALRLDRRRPGYVVDVPLGAPGEPAAPAGPADAQAERFLQATTKWWCRVVCGGRPVDGGRRLAALLAAVLLSEEAAFHGQTLRL